MIKKTHEASPLKNKFGYSRNHKLRVCFILSEESKMYALALLFGMLEVFEVYRLAIDDQI